LFQGQKKKVTKKNWRAEHVGGSEAKAQKESANEKKKRKFGTNSAQRK